MEELLRFFEERGEVYLVRMPVSEEMQGIERKYMPDFDDRMEKIARLTGTEYMSFFEKSGAYTTTDGNHLWREDARRFSNALAERINK